MQRVRHGRRVGGFFFIIVFVRKVETYVSRKRCEEE